MIEGIGVNLPIVPKKPLQCVASNPGKYFFIDDGQYDMMDIIIFRIDLAEPLQPRFQVQDKRGDQAGLTEVQLKCCKV